MASEDRQKIALELLQAAAAGNAREAMERYVAPGCKHHNPYFPAGMPALQEAMDEEARAHPNKLLEVKHILADGELVAIHSHIRQDEGDPGRAVVHIFRFEGNRVVELWDIGEDVPENAPNVDGMF